MTEHGVCVEFTRERVAGERVAGAGVGGVHVHVHSPSVRSRIRIRTRERERECGRDEMRINKESATGHRNRAGGVENYIRRRLKRRPWD